MPAEFLTIHASNPQSRLISAVSAVLRQGGVVILPTDSGYSLCCALEQKNAMERIQQIRRLEPKHFFTLFCQNFSEVAHYARVDNQNFRFLKANTPAPVTFILEATREVPRRLLQPNRRTIGIRIPLQKILMMVLEDFGEPLMSVSMAPEEEECYSLDPLDLLEQYEKRVDLVVDGGVLLVTPTTVVDLTKDQPVIVRQGDYQFT